MTLEQAYVPKTRSQVGLPPLDPVREDAYGASVTEEVKRELWEALGDSPISAAASAGVRLVRPSALNSLMLMRRLMRMICCRSLVCSCISP